MEKGFTLVELSIVLVIIGLLIGGILVGQSLVESVKINSLVSQTSQYHVLMRQFRERYRYYPGDLPNASGLFGGLCGGNCLTNRSGNNCANGSGTGVVNRVAPGSGQRRETRSVLCHLSKGIKFGEDFDLAPSISGGDANWVIGEDYAETAFNDVGLGVSGTESDNAPLQGKYRYHLRAGYRGTSNSDILNNGGFVPQVAQSIDLKTDDGIWNDGEVQSRAWDSCTSGSGYLLSVDTETCYINFYEPDINRALF